MEKLSRRQALQCIAASAAASPLLLSSSSASDLPESAEKVPTESISLRWWSDFTIEINWIAGAMTNWRLATGYTKCGRKYEFNISWNGLMMHDVGRPCAPIYFRRCNPGYDSAWYCVDDDRKYHAYREEDPNWHILRVLMRQMSENIPQLALCVQAFTNVLEQDVKENSCDPTEHRPSRLRLLGAEAGS
jgi:hypothetical protein